MPCLPCRRTSLIHAFALAGLLVAGAAGLARADDPYRPVLMTPPLVVDAGQAAANAPVQSPPLPRARPLHAQRNGDFADVPLPRPSIRDGDVAYPPEPQAITDGVIETGEEQGALDGVGLATADTRRPEDIAAFEAPPAGYDPLLFQIEDIAPADPRRNRAPGRLFSREPYDPTGVRIGSFVLFPELELAGLGTSNALSAPRAEADRAFELLPSARVVSNWSNHALEFGARGTLSSYDTFDSEDDRAFAVEGRGRLDVTRRTNVQGLISRERAQESRSAIDAATGGARATFTTDTVAGAAQHRFNRLRLELRGGVTETTFADAENADRDVHEGSIGLRASYELKPSLSPFIEAERIEEDYRAATAADGIGRDSTGERYRGGIALGQTGEIWRGEFAIGYGRQDVAAAALADLDALVIDANVAWRASPATAFLFTAASDITGTTTAGTGAVLDRRFGLEVRHAFRAHLIGTAGIGFLHRDFAGIDIEERETTASLGVEYFASREAVLFTRYQHTSFRSDFSDSDYDADEIRIGVKLRR